ncbi:MAG: 6-pyruvoyl trahydropterin synthase family protein [Candidatus Heimdallarchaeaceae archaeon]
MYRVVKEMEIAAAHHLDLPYQSKCIGNHGHNFKVIVYCQSEELDGNGMVVDFTVIKKKIHGFLDHKDLNTLFEFNPTAENLAYWICCQIDSCYKVDVQESTGNVATYIKE